MKLAKTIALSVAAIGFATGSAMAGDEYSSAPDETYVLLGPVEVQALYEVDEDGDGVTDYLILEGSDDSLAALFEESQREPEVPEGG